MIKFYNRDLFRINTETLSASEEKNEVKRVITFRSIPIGLNSEEHIIGKCHSTGDDDQNIRIWAQTQKGKTYVKMSASSDNLYDTDVYMVAIPFNGIIKPVEKSYDYRIFRAIIAKSERRDIEFNGEFYKNIMYMILVPNAQLLWKEDHKYHKDALTFEFSYVVRTSTSKETTVTLTFTKEGLVSSVKEADVSDDYADDFTTRGQLFPIYRPSEKATAERKQPKKDEPNQDKLKNNEEERKKKRFDKFTQPKTPYVKKEKQQKQKPQKPVEAADSKLDEMINEMNRKFSCEHSKSDKRSKKKRRK